MAARKVIKSLLPLLQIYPWAIPAIVILGILASLAEGIGISLFIPFLQNMNQTSLMPDIGNRLVDPLGRLFNEVSPDNRLLVISICIFGSALLRNALSYGNDVLFYWLDTRISYQIRSNIFKQLLTVSYHYLETSPAGKLLNTLDNETWRTSQALSIFVGLIVAVCTLVVFIVLLFLISWKLTLLVAISMLMLSVLLGILTRRAELLGQQRTEATESLLTRILEGFGGMKVIRAFGRESYEQQRFDVASDKVSLLLMKINIISGAVNPIYEIFAAGLLVLILFNTLQNPDNLATVLVFIFILYRLQPKIKAIDRARVDLAALSFAVEEVASFLDTTNKVYLSSGSVSFERVGDAICFENVSFQYGPSEKPAIENVSFCIAPGKTTALVGQSGAGKSTLIKLLLRFYDPTKGEIHVGDSRLQDFDVVSWRSRIAMVSQDVYMFNESVMKNIAYGRPSASEEEIIAAAKQAQAHDFICELPEGYATLLGDRGARLSGGQQQRITLARAIVCRPDILILDEATNALDSISEHLIQRALEKLSKECTMLVIAHRLSTVKRADHIVVLEEGRVREQGDLEYLLEIDGLFAKLYSLQYDDALS